MARIGGPPREPPGPQPSARFVSDEEKRPTKEEDEAWARQHVADTLVRQPKGKAKGARTAGAKRAEPAKGAERKHAMPRAELPEGAERKNAMPPRPSTEEGPGDAMKRAALAHSHSPRILLAYSITILV